MNWTNLAENRIQEAMANGEFDHLPGRGQSLDLAEYFALPPTERAGAMLLKNANVIPPEVQLLKEIAELEDTILDVERADLANERNGNDEKNGNCRENAFQFSSLSHSSHEARKRTKRLAELREQLQEKRVAFALAMERRRRDPRATD